MITTAPPSPPTRSLLRLRLAPHSALPRRLDGAWWPRSYDLLAELPQLLAALPPDTPQEAAEPIMTAALSDRD